MNPGFQEGRRPRANAVASLANTGHVSPLARRPSAGAVAHTHHPVSARRPGPRPMSARQTMALNAQNARIRREVEQTIAECRREVQRSNSQVQRRAASLPFSQIDFDKRARGRDAASEVAQVPGTYRQMDVTRYAAGGLWVYVTTLHDGWGDHEYFVFNPETGALLQFTPEAAIDPKRRLYASKRAQIQGTAAGTGVVGGYLEKGFLGTSALFLTGGLAAEAGAYAFVAEEVAPVVARIAVQGYRISQPVIKAALARARDGFMLRAGTDLSIQLGGGFAMGNGSALNRTKQAISGVNVTSVLLAGAINTNGMTLNRLAKWLIPATTAAVSNGFTVNGDNLDKYGSYAHLVNLADGQEAAKYAFNIILGTVLDRSREVLTEHGTEKLVGMAARASGRAQQAAVRWISASRVNLHLNLDLGISFESGKKSLEQWWDGHNDEVKKQEAARLKQANGAKPKPTTGHAK
jgi:hypothetical protein